MTSNPCAINEIWEHKQRNDKMYWLMRNGYNLSHFISNFIAHKETIDESNFADFLSPKIRNLMPSPNELTDIDKATTYIIKSIKEKKKITIFADYDVDGATSAAIMIKFLRFFQVDVSPYVPHRVNEGYGPNEKALIKLKEEGTNLVITVDCGTVAFEPLEAAHKAGLDIVVIDHHIGIQSTPKAIAIVNPNRHNEKTDLKYLCAAGVCFMLCSSIITELGNLEIISNKKIKEAKSFLLSLTDLVALGTICDVVPLIKLNRAFVQTGLNVMQKRLNFGITALAEISNINSQINSTHLGYKFGPMINAGGRIGADPTIGTRLLTSEDIGTARILATKLETLNQKRMAMEQECVKDAINEASKKIDNNIIFIYSDQWHQGIIGIIASRVKDVYNMPTIVGSLSIDLDTKEHIIKTSCRSIAGYNIGSIVIQAKNYGLIEYGGGHEMAAGFTSLLKNQDKLEAFFNSTITSELRLQTSRRKIIITDNITTEGLHSLVDDLEMLEPFGTSNQRPVFEITNLSILRTDVINNSHIKFVLKCNTSNTTTTAIAFRSVGGAIESFVNQYRNKAIDIAVSAGINYYNNKKSLNLIIEDIRVANLI